MARARARYSHAPLAQPHLVGAGWVVLVGGDDLLRVRLGVSVRVTVRTKV